MSGSGLASGGSSDCRADSQGPAVQTNTVANVSCRLVIIYFITAADPCGLLTSIKGISAAVMVFSISVGMLSA